jgi:hypothetical protein
MGGRGRSGLFGASFAGHEDADTLDHFGGRAGALGQEDVGVKGAIEGVDGAGDDHRRQALMELFGAANQFVAVHLRHQEIAQDQVECAGERSLQDFQRFLSGVDRDDAVTTGFEKEGADGEHLFVVIYAEDRLLGAHAVSLLLEATLWWLAADRPVWRVCWFAGAPVWWCSESPVARPYTAVRRDGSLLLRERGRRKSEALPSAPLGTRSMCPTSEAAEPRGAREALCGGRLPAAPEGKGSLCCEYSENRCRKELAFDLNACADSEVALGESRLRGSQASLNSDCQKTGESNFHLQQRGTLHATSSSMLSNSTNGWLTWQRRS